jgi:hypothetical protein
MVCSPVYYPLGIARVLTTGALCGHNITIWRTGHGLCLTGAGLKTVQRHSEEWGVDPDVKRCVTVRVER